MIRNLIGFLFMVASTTTSAVSFAFLLRHLGSHSKTIQARGFSSPRFSTRPSSASTRSLFSRRMGTEYRNPKKRPLAAATGNADVPSDDIPLYLEEGLFAVRKPLGWTSQDVVGKLRFVLEKDARARGAPDRRTKKRRPWMKVGHGGTLDPLATGVLVCGVGKGTSQLQKYLVGSKAYRAEVTLGYQTTTLDSDPKGEVVAEKPFDHVTSYDEIESLLESKFKGKIQQIPPIFSALKRDGKKLYELGRKGQTAEDIQIEPREVTIYDLKLLRPSDHDGEEPIRRFQIDVECGGGTYIRSLVRDIGLELGTVATMTALERTKQGLFLPEHCVPYLLPEGSETEEKATTDDNGAIVIDKRGDCNWTVETITEGIRRCRELLTESETDGLKDV